MSNLIQQGLWISVVGFGLLFVFMGLITLMMILLERLTRHSTQPSRQDRTTIQAGSVAKSGENEEIAAAIAVAIAHFRAQDSSRSNLGSTLESGHRHWWLTGRTRQNPSRPGRTLKWEN